MRIEHDLLGERSLPQDALYGIHTLRAFENFPFDYARLSKSLVKSLVIVKKACCITNQRLGYLNDTQSAAIIAACDDLLAGKNGDAFCLDALCGGAGTSVNMMVNEVIANTALQKLGKNAGEYEYLHPIEAVNLHQSTNDVFPTAIKVGAIGLLRALSSACALLQGSFQKKESAWAHVIIMGRTECMDAVPMTMGAQFSSFAEALARDRWRTFKCEERLRVVNLGGTAIGTGLTAPRDYIFTVTDVLRELTGYGITRAENLVDATANADSFVEVAGILGACAANLIKIADDIRLLHMLGEIRLPAVAAGSSIMPGKVNPVILESIIQCSMRVRSECSVVAECASRGTLQINEFLPLLSDALLKAISLLCKACSIFAAHIDQCEVDEDRCNAHSTSSTAMITALVSVIGYEKAQDLVVSFKNSSEKVFVKYLKAQLGDSVVEKALSPQKIMSLGHV